MKRLIAAACGVLVVGSVACSPAPAETALCVGSGSGCRSTLQAAIDAAHAGDTIRIGPGTFTGGVTVNVSVTIAGAGASSTIIKGGNSVLTIGKFNAPSEPTVSITGVTITGGMARSSPYSNPSNGIASYAGVLAQGGGIEIPRSAAGKGATVTIANSVITGNRVAPSQTLPIGPPCPGNVNCPYAEADGGGIDDWGRLTLGHTTVSENLVGSASGLSALASDANGGGIMVESTGTLVVNDSMISNNHASATAPNGRNVDSGGIYVEGPTLTMNRDLVTNNTAELSAALPFTNSTDCNSPQVDAIAGGVHVSNRTSGTISDTTISGNSVSATNSLGDATADSGGLHSDGPLALVLSNDIISGNMVSATAPLGSSGSAYADSGAGELNAPGPIRKTRFTGNSVEATSSARIAQASAGAFIASSNPLTTISDSVISDNRLSATTTSGSAIVEGGGIQTVELLTLQNTVVENNTGTARGPAGMAQGGGIWNGTIPCNTPPDQLMLSGSAVTGNTLTASPGITVKGGGLYTRIPVAQAGNTIARNLPDQCFGC